MATAQILDANNTAGKMLMNSITGTPLDCPGLTSNPPGGLSGLNTVSAFTTLDLPTTQDIVVTTSLVCQ
jgi:hypothetical protein